MNTISDKTNLYGCQAHSRKCLVSTPICGSCRQDIKMQPVGEVSWWGGGGWVVITSPVFADNEYYVILLKSEKKRACELEK